MMKPPALPVPAIVTAGLALLVLACAVGVASLLPAADVPAPSTAIVRLAEGFDYPVGWPEAVGYNKARGFHPNGHLGEDWNGDGGGNTDLGDPIYCVGNGLVVWARDVHLGWGNVVIVRHGFRDPAEGGALKTVDTLYGHLDRIGVREGQAVTRGQVIATMGDNHGMYDAHLHFEVRKNIQIGMQRSQYARDFSNYYDPTQFIQTHRTVAGSGGRSPIAVNTFAPYPGSETALPPGDAAYELGALRGPNILAPRLNKSAYDIKRRPTGNPNFDKLNTPFRVDRFSDLRK